MSLNDLVFKEVQQQYFKATAPHSIGNGGAAHCSTQPVRHERSITDKSLDHVREHLVPSSNNVRQLLTQHSVKTEQGYILPWTEDKTTNTVGLIRHETLNNAVSAFSGGIPTKHTLHRNKLQQILLHGDTRVPTNPSVEMKETITHNQQQLSFLDMDTATCSMQDHSKCGSSGHSALPKRKIVDAAIVSTDPSKSSLAPSATTSGDTTTSMWKLKNQHYQGNAVGVVQKP